MSAPGRCQDPQVSGPKARREARDRERGGQPTKQRLLAPVLQGGCRIAPEREARTALQ